MRDRDRSPVDVTPSARRLTSSLRDIGYDFVAALADVVDNSVTAGATEIDIEIVFDGLASYILIADNGSGMTRSELTEALRFGTRRDYEDGELGRYGLGLKTASISQCRRVTVVSRRALRNRRLWVKTLDLTHIEETDRWEVIPPPVDSMVGRSLEWLNRGPGTVVLWEHLDRILPERQPEGGWARRRLEQLAERARDYLGMVFHRFLEGEAQRELPLTISVNGEKAQPWNPFAPLEDRRLELGGQAFEMNVGDRCGTVTLHRYVLPPRSLFSSLAEFERLSGPGKWNRQQGIYIYRADRLIQHGGWCGIRASDEHTKFARASLDFPTELDPLFQINVAKMRVALPAELRSLIERPIHEVCRRADHVYRRDSQTSLLDDGDPKRPTTDERPDSTATPADSRRPDALGIGTALMSAALGAGEHEAFARIMERLQAVDPVLAESLGW